MIESRKELAAKLADVVGDLEDQELLVLILLARRLLLGQHGYGALALALDERDLDEEMGSETADLLVYAAMGWLKQQLAKEKSTP
ncbi:MAG TPA: hypothetical protein VFT22_11025 [Kofleriaceae bacterium]|nr:hypothetical protein [Kofleriaceae bacterium]